MSVYRHPQNKGLKDKADNIYKFSVSGGFQTLIFSE